MLDKLKNKILQSSDSYNHYKNENKLLKKELSELTKRVEETENQLTYFHEFLENIYLDHDLKPTNLWNQIQILETELLTFIDNVCVKYNIDYWLDYGTLLGASRHGGFIPWDDDIDIAVMRLDFEKIYPILRDEIKIHNLDDYIDLRVYHSNVKDIVLGFIQFSYCLPDGGMILSNVDIFPYDYIDSDEVDFDLYDRERSKFFIDLVEEDDPSKIVKRYVDKLNVSYDVEKFIIPGPEGPRGMNGYGCCVYNKNIIFPLNKIRFRDKYFNCPNNVDEYLRGIYGDYSHIPNKIAHHNLLKSLKNIDNISNELSIAINKLKQINE